MAGNVTVTWLGHATFEVAAAGARFLIDPWLSGNPSVPANLKSTSRYSGKGAPTAVLVTHAHGDHCTDAVEAAKVSGAPLIGEYDWVTSLGLPDSQGIGMNVGGRVAFGGVSVNAVPAIHSSPPSGRPLGFVIDFGGGDVVYNTGDTWIFGDMALIGEIYNPTVILMNMGGGPYTQDPKTAALAVKKYFTPRAIIPFHWGTFPALASEADIRAAFKDDDRLVLLKPGESRAV